MLRARIACIGGACLSAGIGFLLAAGIGFLLAAGIGFLLAAGIGCVMRSSLRVSTNACIGSCMHRLMHACFTFSGVQVQLEWERLIDERNAASDERHASPIWRAAPCPTIVQPPVESVSAEEQLRRDSQAKLNTFKNMRIPYVSSRRAPNMPLRQAPRMVMEVEADDEATATADGKQSEHLNLSI